MSLLSVVTDVCAVVGVNIPTSVVTNIGANRTMQEMLALANEMAHRIAYDTRDWSKLRVLATLPGDGATTAFNLPVNYKRMLLRSNVWLSTSPHTPMAFIADTEEWLMNRLSTASSLSWGEWTMMGGQIHIWPAMAVGVNASFLYLDKNCIDLTSGGAGDAFMADTDSFTLDERLLKLGMIWQWKANKGTSYAEDMGTYGVALESALGRDRPAPIIIDRPARRAYYGGWDAYV